MAEQEIHNVNIKISGAEDTGSQVKIRDQNQRIYSFFKTKKDGGETEAYRSYRQFKVGDTALVTFKEVPYKNGTIKNVMMFKPATGEPDQAAVTPQAQWRARGQGQPGREYWEQREAKRQSSILMQVAFKAAVTIQAAKINAGEKEDRDWLYNTTLEYYDWLEERIEEPDGGNTPPPPFPEARGRQENEDEIIF